MVGNRSELKKQLWIVAFAKTSIHAARVACEFAINHATELDQATYRIMTTGFTVLYARPFGKNRGVGKLPDAFKKFQDPQLQNTHDAIMNARDKFFAHTDADYGYTDGDKQEQILKLEVMAGPITSDASRELRTQITFPEVLRGNLPIYLALCDELLRRLEEREQTLLLQLYDGGENLKDGLNPVNIFDES